MQSADKTPVTAFAALVLIAAMCWSAPAVQAQEEATTVQISVKNHRFQPAEIRAPANKPIVLKLKNLDATPMEFESVTLRVEKVVVGNSEGIIRLRALAPGRYNFFDDFNSETRGTLVVQ
jgi:hypothetical protein